MSITSVNIWINIPPTVTEKHEPFERVQRVMAECSVLDWTFALEQIGDPDRELAIGLEELAPSDLHGNPLSGAPNPLTYGGVYKTGGGTWTCFYHQVKEGGSYWFHGLTPNTSLLEDGDCVVIGTVARVYGQASASLIVPSGDNRIRQESFEPALHKAFIEATLLSGQKLH